MSTERIYNDDRTNINFKGITNFIVTVVDKTIMKWKVKVSDPSCFRFINFSSISPLNVELKGKSAIDEQ